MNHDIEMPDMPGWIFYILDDDHRLVEVPDLMQWAHWSFGENQDRRRIALSMVGDIAVSTIFLGCVSRGMTELGIEPRMFETLVSSQYSGRNVQRKYATWDEAVAGHQEIVAELQRDAEHE